MTFTPINLVTRPRYWRFENSFGIEFEANGVEARYELLLEVASNLDEIAERGMSVLTDFMKHVGTFQLDSVMVRRVADDDGALFVLRYFFTASGDPHKFGYTYFDVAYTIHDPPMVRFWPIKFTVGFH